MPDKSDLSVQTFLAQATETAAAELIAALDALPPDRRDWQATKTARSALDQFAECALLNDNTADLIRQRRGNPAIYADEYVQRIAALRADEAGARALLTASGVRASAAIRSVPDGDLNDAIPLPWGPITLRELIAFPFWNMTYHQGQIRYIATLLAPVPLPWSFLQRTIRASSAH